MIKWLIYKIISPSGKVYIGKTNGNYKKREKYYKSGNCKGQPRLFASFKKYGYDSHEVKIIDEFESDIECAAGKEMFWIRSCMTNYCKFPEMNGLNLTDGGEGNIGMKMSEESRKKISEYVKNNPIRYWKGVKFSDERKKQMSDYKKANPYMGWKGKKRSEEDKKKMVENRRANGGYLVSDETRKKKSLALKGRKRNVWWGYKIKGRKMSPESIAKMIASKKQRLALMSEEERKEKFGKHNIGATFNKGRKHTGTHLENIRNNLKKARMVKNKI